MTIPCSGFSTASSGKEQDGWPALISQEMSTGYPGAETGHATRFYTQVHQTAQALVGNWAYEYNDPAVFLETHAFITSELAEALRRTGEQTGRPSFFAATWFRNVLMRRLLSLTGV